MKRWVEENGRDFIHTPYHRAVAKAAPTTAALVSLSASWYKNAEFSDITILYGGRENRTFRGHRLVLCNSSKWFHSTLCGGFAEAGSNIINLKGDDPRGIEALLEFCYLGRYREPAGFGGKCILQTMADTVLLHARAFVVGDKYMAAEFCGYAIGCVEHSIEQTFSATHYCPDKTRRFLKWLIETVYVRPRLFGLDEDGEIADEGLQEGADVEDIIGGDVNDICDFEQKELAAASNDTQPRHPLDRIRRLVVRSVVSYTLENTRRANVDRRHLMVLAKQMPQFGADLAMVLLKKEGRA